MHARVWRLLRSLTRLVVEEATRTFLDWAWRGRRRQPRSGQQRREPGGSWR